MSSDCNIIWSKRVTDLSLQIESRHGVDPMTALDLAIYQLSNKSFERKPTDHEALACRRADVARRGWQTRKANVA